MFKAVVSVAFITIVLIWGVLAFLNLYTEGTSTSVAQHQRHDDGSASLREDDLLRDAMFTIGFGSCNKHNRNQSFWQYVEEAIRSVSTSSSSSSSSSSRSAGGSQSLLGGFIWLGDVVYADTTYGPGIWLLSSIQTMKAKYEALANNQYYKAFADACRYVVGVWDDHDMGCNDGGMECPVKDDVQGMFLDFLKVPPSDTERRQERKGLYSVQRMEFDPDSIEASAATRRLASQYEYALCVVLLDARYYRTPITDNRTGAVLGEVQWEWLENTFQQLGDGAGAGEAERKKKHCLAVLIGSGIQVLADEKPAEQWGNFKSERERLFNLVRKTHVNRAMFISGDVHLAEIQKEDSGVDTCANGTAIAAMGYPIIDVTASGFTHTTGDIMPEALFDAWLPSPRRLGRHLNRNFATFSLHAESNEKSPTKEEGEGGRVSTENNETGSEDEVVAQFVVYDILSQRPVLQLKQRLADLEASKYAEACGSLEEGRTGSRRSSSLHYRFDDAEFPPLKRTLLGIKNAVPALKMHQVIYVILFSAMGAGVPVVVGMVALVLRCVSGSTKSKGGGGGGGPSQEQKGSAKKKLQ